MPAVGPCYDSLPQPAPLNVDVNVLGENKEVTVTASIEHDTRPVHNASVIYNGVTIKTDQNGKAIVPSDASFKVTAGDTFLMAEVN